jgi:hypothetical protein
MKLAVIVLVISAGIVSVATAEPIELKEAGNDTYRVMAGKKELAVLMPDAWQGNLNIVSTKNKTVCGVNWPHFLLYSEGKWLTDRVESEGLKLVEFKTLKTSGSLIGYSVSWKFRDYCISSECHFAWYDDASGTQVHLVKTQIEILKNLTDISSAWVEFMSPENSYTTVAAKTKNSKVITMDVSKTGENANMHYLDGYELANDGWITIYGARKGQDACVAMAPVNHSPGAVRPRINNGHVDNIEIHVLDARKRNSLTKGRTFYLEYLLLVGPDQKDWKWIDPAIQSARTFMTNNATLLDCPMSSR